MKDSEREVILRDLKKDFNIEDFIQFDEFNFREREERYTFELMRYDEQRMKEKMKFEDLESLYRKLKGKQFHYYRFGNGSGPYELSNKEIETYYFVQDKKLIQMEKILQRQKLRLEYFEMCVRLLEKMGFRLREYLEWIKKGGM